jgi:sodium/proline symporter
VKPESFDQIMPLVIAETLPTVVAAVILILVLSASMSTLASVVIAAGSAAAGSAVAVDLVKTVKPDMEQEKNTLILRCVFVVFVILSYVLARSGSSVLNLAAISWGAVSGCLLAPYLLGLYWKRANKYGALAGMAVALLVELIGVLTLEGGFASPYIPVVGAIAIVLPIGVNIVVSLLTKEHEEVHLNHIYNIKPILVGEEN